MTTATRSIRAIEFPADDDSINRALADLNAKLSAWSAAVVNTQDAWTAPAADVTTPESGSQANALRLAAAAVQPTFVAQGPAPGTTAGGTDKKPDTTVLPSLVFKTATVEPTHADAPQSNADPVAAVTGATSDAEHDDAAMRFFSANASDVKLPETNEEKCGKPARMSETKAALFYGDVEPASEPAVVPPNSVAMNSIYDDVAADADEVDLWRRAEEIALRGSVKIPATAVIVADEPDDDERLLATLDAETANAVRIQRRLTGKAVKELIGTTQASVQAVPAAAPVEEVRRPARSWWNWGQT